MGYKYSTLSTINSTIIYVTIPAGSGLDLNRTPIEITILLVQQNDVLLDHSMLIYNASGWFFSNKM
jgi:archaellin